jgi:hypothetical protein
MHVPGIPRTLVVTAKSLAAVEGLTLREWTQRALEEAVLVDRRPKNDKVRVEPDPVDSSPAVGGVVVESVAAGPCPICERPTKRWGSQRRCERCGRNFPL